MSLQEEINLSDIFTTAIFGVSILDDHGFIISNNKSAQRLLGIETSTTKENLYNLIDLDSFKQLKKIYHDSPNQHERLIVSAVRTEKELEVDVSATQVNEHTRWILLWKDLTERKELENKIDKSEEEKENIENELKKEQELSDLKSRFISTASHEFRTPLAGILSSSNLIKRYLIKDQTFWEYSPYKNKLEKHFDKISTSIKNLDLILSQFLSIRRIEEEKGVEVKKKELVISPYFQNLLSDLEIITKNGQEIKLSVTGENTFVTDPDLIKIILNNTVSNAIKYSGQNTLVQVDIKNDTTGLNLKISDQGIGIPKNEQPNIFKRFYRAHNATNEQGTGLGLYIIKQYVDLLDGELWFKSEENKGTTFYINLPIK